MSPTLTVCRDAADAARTAADVVSAAARDAIADHGRFRWALAGGSTPRALYELMAHDGALPWSDVALYFGDERCVPPDDEGSNFRMVQRALLDRVTPGAVHRIEGELGPQQAAARYAELLDGEGPLDLVLLGMGGDGHTASLFPGSDALDASARAVASVSPVPPTERVSLTLRAIDEARGVVVLVTGGSKAERLAQAYDEIARGAPKLPIAMLRPGGAYRWIVDEPAASKLPGRDA